MIREECVLFRIQYFQHCIGWITLIVSTHLVNFINQEYRIDNTGLLHALNDSSW